MKKSLIVRGMSSEEVEKLENHNLVAMCQAITGKEIKPLAEIAPNKPSKRKSIDSPSPNVKKPKKKKKKKKNTS